MDRKESMLMSGSSYYTQRGVPDLHGKQGIHPLTSSSMPFQLNSGGSSSLPAFVAEPNSVISPDVMNANAPSAQPFNASVRRKRGRPRKYGPDGTVSLALLPSSANLHPQGMKTPTQKRGRGRPPGTGRKQQLASFGKWPSGSAGVGFTPHIITIAAGEDIAANIISFAQQGPRAVCILSVNGAVSTVTLRQPSTPAGSITYEGRFEILSMSGSFLLMNNDGFHSPTVDMSISLASPDGRVIGGGVGEMLIAATPVQVILGSFIWGSSKMKHKMGKRVKVGGDSGHHSADNVMAPASIQQSQTPTSSMGTWPSPQAVDIQNAHFDIDLMHG